MPPKALREFLKSLPANPTVLSLPPGSPNLLGQGQELARW